MTSSTMSDTSEVSHTTSNTSIYSSDCSPKLETVHDATSRPQGRLLQQPQKSSQQDMDKQAVSPASDNSLHQQLELREGPEGEQQPLPTSTAYKHLTTPIMKSVQNLQVEPQGDTVSVDSEETISCSPTAQTQPAQPAQPTQQTHQSQPPSLQPEPAQSASSTSTPNPPKRKSVSPKTFLEPAPPVDDAAPAHFHPSTASFARTPVDQSAEHHRIEPCTSSAHSSNTSTDTATSTNSDNGGEGADDDSFLFTKKELSKARPSTSAFSSFTSPHKPIRHKHKRAHAHHAASSKHDPSAVMLATSCECSSPPPTSPLVANDRNRIRTPASTVPPSIASSLEIGAQFPFQDGKRDTGAADSQDRAPLANRTAHVKSTLRRSATSSSELILPRLQQARSSKYLPAEVQYAPKDRHLSKKEGTDAFDPHSVLNFKSTVSAASSPDNEDTLGFRTDAQALSGAKGVNGSARQPKHMHNLKTPMYVPAVLRQTDYRAQITPEQSTPRTTPLASTPILQPPSKAHWVNDEARQSCKTCLKSFTLFDRRHHCRRCGEIFCAQHSRHTIRLDTNLGYSPLGYPSRACQNCYIEYQQAIRPQGRVILSSSGAGIGSLPKAVAVERPNGSAIENADQTTRRETVGSIPADWSWSTF